MTITVRFFARARDLAGTDKLAVTLPTGATVADLRRQIAQDRPALAGLLERSALAVNDDFADDRTSLADGGDVAVLPPVSGG